MSIRHRSAVWLAATAAIASAVSLVVGTGSASAFPAPAGCPAAGSYDNTIPTPVGPPTAASLTTEGHPHQVVYSALGADGKLYLTINNAYNTYRPGELFCLGGQATDAPGIVAYDDGARSVAAFVRAANGRLYQRYITGQNFTSAGAYTVVNDAASTNGPAALLFNGQFHLFVRGTNGALYHGFRQTDSLSSWRFEKVGGAIVGSPVAVVDGSRMLVAMTGTNGAVYTVTGTSFAWGPFARISNQVEGDSPAQVLTRTQPSLVRDPRNGEITIYAAGLAYGLFSLTRPAGSTFADRSWVRIDSVLPADARISAAVTVHNDTVVYARFLDRSTGRYLTAYTQRFGGGSDCLDRSDLCLRGERPAGVPSVPVGSQWSDYVLVPYTCLECAPFAGGGPGLAARSMPRLPVAPLPRR